jgi:molybdenum cofactor biosynthesis enzyme
MTVDADGRRQVLSARQDLLGAERSEGMVEAEHLRLSLEPRLAFLSATRNLQAADWENQNLMAEMRVQFERAGLARDMSFEQFRQEAQMNTAQAVRSLQERLDQDYRRLTAINQAEMTRLTGEVRVAATEQDQRVVDIQFKAELDRQAKGGDFVRGQKQQDFAVETEQRLTEIETARLAAKASQENTAELLRIEREDELARVRNQVEMRNLERRMEVECLTLLKDIPQETILAMKSPEQFAAVLRERAGVELNRQFVTMNTEQQAVFLARMQEMMTHAMAQNARVADTAAQRPASVVFGPAFSNPTTITPPAVPPPSMDRP